MVRTSRNRKDHCAFQIHCCENIPVYAREETRYKPIGNLPFLAPVGPIFISQFRNWDDDSTWYNRTLGICRRNDGCFLEASGQILHKFMPAISMRLPLVEA